MSASAETCVTSSVVLASLARSAAVGTASVGAAALGISTSVSLAYISSRILLNSSAASCCSASSSTSSSTSTSVSFAASAEAESATWIASRSSRPPARSASSQSARDKPLRNLAAVNASMCVYTLNGSRIDVDATSSVSTSVATDSWPSAGSSSS